MIPGYSNGSQSFCLSIVEVKASIVLQYKKQKLENITTKKNIYIVFHISSSTILWSFRFILQLSRGLTAWSGTTRLEVKMMLKGSCVKSDELSKL